MPSFCNRRWNRALLPYRYRSSVHASHPGEVPRRSAGRARRCPCAPRRARTSAAARRCRSGGAPPTRRLVLATPTPRPTRSRARRDADAAAANVRGWRTACSSSAPKPPIDSPATARPRRAATVRYGRVDPRDELIDVVGLPTAAARPRLRPYQSVSTSRRSRRRA